VKIALPRLRHVPRVGKEHRGARCPVCDLETFPTLRRPHEGRCPGPARSTKQNEGKCDFRRFPQNAWITYLALRLSGRLPRQSSKASGTVTVACALIPGPPAAAANLLIGARFMKWRGRRPSGNVVDRRTTTAARLGGFNLRNLSGAKRRMLDPSRSPSANKQVLVITCLFSCLEYSARSRSLRFSAA